MYTGYIIVDYGSFALAMVLLVVSIYYLTIYKLQEEVRLAGSGAQHSAVTPGWRMGWRRGAEAEEARQSRRPAAPRNHHLHALDWPRDLCVAAAASGTAARCTS